MKKSINVVMLPTNEKATDKPFSVGITLCNNGKLVIGNPVGKSESRQHLYFTSDEKPEIGDWCVVNGIGVRKYNGSEFSSQKKIIATTDRSLTYLSEPHKDSYGDLRHNKFIDLPQPSPQPSPEFVRKYIESYNKGDIITKVMVEYIDNGYEDWAGDNYTGEPFWNEILQLKIGKNNYITITRCKDSWTKEEVMNLCQQSFELGQAHGSIYKGNNFNNWIEKNLNLCGFTESNSTG